MAPNAGVAGTAATGGTLARGRRAGGCSSSTMRIGLGLRRAPVVAPHGRRHRGHRQRPAAAADQQRPAAPRSRRQHGRPAALFRAAYHRHRPQVSSDGRDRQPVPRQPIPIRPVRQGNRGTTVSRTGATRRPAVQGAGATAREIPRSGRCQRNSRRMITSAEQRTHGDQRVLDLRLVQGGGQRCACPARPPASGSPGWSARRPRRRANHARARSRPGWFPRRGPLRLPVLEVQGRSGRRPAVFTLAAWTAPQLSTVGDPAPPFTLPDADGNPVSLSDFAGRPVIVYFYPAAMTPGCTTEACDFSSARAPLDDGGLRRSRHLAGQAGTSWRSSGTRRDLTITLLSDADRSVMTAYGAYGEKQHVRQDRAGRHPVHLRGRRRRPARTGLAQRQGHRPRRPGARRTWVSPAS